MKNKYLLSVYFFLFFFFSSASFARALEARYPSIPGLPTLSGSSSITDFIGYFFGLGIYLAGALALISFAVGGIQYIASFDSAETASKAKDRVKGSILGLLLILTSFIIMKTINVTLTTPTVGNLDPAAIADNTLSAGVYFYSGAGCTCDNSASLAENQVKLDGCIQKCQLNNQAGFNGYGAGYAPCVDSCNKTYAIPADQDPCQQGGVSGAITSSQDGFDFTFKPKSFKVINDTENRLFYGIILHAPTGYKNGGLCTTPDYSIQPVKCYAISGSVSYNSVDIFAIKVDSPNYAGNGVIFYSEPFGWKNGAEAGIFEVPANEIYMNSKTLDASVDMKYDFTDVKVNPPYKSACATFKKCQGSILVDGTYLVGVYSGDPKNPWCQTFTDNVENLAAQSITAPGAKTGVREVYLFPLE